VIGRSGRVQKTAAETVRSGVWKQHYEEKLESYIGSTWTMDKKGHVNSNANMKKIEGEFYYIL